MLCGPHKQACLKNYLATTIPGEICKEVGLRLLLGFIARIGASLEFAVRPLLSVSFYHFFRVFIEVKRSSQEATNIIHHLGYVRYCIKCGYRDFKQEYPSLTTNIICPNCDQQLHVGGPLWIGSLQDGKILDSIEKILQYPTQIEMPKQILRLVKLWQNEDSFPPYYYNVHKICDKIQAWCPRFEILIERLNNLGISSTRTHFEPRAIKSMGQINEIIDVIHELMKERTPVE